MKYCPRCQTIKEDSAFAFKSKVKGTLASECKACHRVIQNQVYKANPTPDKTRARARRKQMLLWLEAYKSQHPCTCGEHDSIALDFHHLDPNEKDLNMAEIARLGWSLKRVQQEIAKCQVICSNCHRKLHRKRFFAGLTQLVE